MLVRSRWGSKYHYSVRGKDWGNNARSLAKEYKNKKDAVSIKAVQVSAGIAARRTAVLAKKRNDLLATRNAPHTVATASHAPTNGAAQAYAPMAAQHDQLGDDAPPHDDSLQSSTSAKRVKR